MPREITVGIVCGIVVAILGFVVGHALDLFKEKLTEADRIEIAKLITHDESYQNKLLERMEDSGKFKGLSGDQGEQGKQGERGEPGPSPTFGQWTPVVVGATYLAETSGFVVARSSGDQSARCNLQMKTPKGRWSLITRCAKLGGGTMPVRQGNSYRVVYVDHAGGLESTIKAYWIPFE